MNRQQICFVLFSFHFKGFLFHANVTEIVGKEFTPDEFLPNFYFKFDCLEIPHFVLLGFQRKNALIELIVLP